MTYAYILSMAPVRSSPPVKSSAKKAAAKKRPFSDLVADDQPSRVSVRQMKEAASLFQEIDQKLAVEEAAVQRLLAKYGL